jgi:hypothetical protein
VTTGAVRGQCVPSQHSVSRMCTVATITCKGLQFCINICIKVQLISDELRLSIFPFSFFKIRFSLFTFLYRGCNTPQIVKHQEFLEFPTGSGPCNPCGENSKREKGILKMEKGKRKESTHRKSAVNDNTIIIILLMLLTMGFVCACFGGKG